MGAGGRGSDRLPVPAPVRRLSCVICHISYAPKLNIYSLSVAVVAYESYEEETPAAAAASAAAAAAEVGGDEQR